MQVVYTVPPEHPVNIMIQIVSQLVQHDRTNIDQNEIQTPIIIT